MRLFIAMPLPEVAVEETAKVLAKLRQQGWPVRWVRDRGFHLTLKFFGEVGIDRADAIGEMLSFATADIGAVVANFSGVEAFPSSRRPRTIVESIGAEPHLEVLQDRIERGADRLGFPPEGRPFRPHVTLGRVREGHRLPPDWEKILEGTEPGESFLVDQVALYESDLTSEGPVYTARHQVRLT